MKHTPFILLAFAGTLGACSKPIATTSAPATTCAKAGQQCEYSPGKLGLCTANGMDCDGSAACLVCMSLH